MAYLPKNLRLPKKYKHLTNALKLTPKDDWRDRIEVELGDSKRPDKFFPQVKIMRWDNEVNASFRLIDDEAKTLRTEGGKVKLVGAKKEVHLYDIAPCEEHPEGGYEFEVILKEKPPTNKLEFSINTKGLDFFYQPPLNQEKLEEGQTATETHIYDKDGNEVAHRPENVVGSYAVYHSTKGAMDNVVGGKLYRVGKAFHIYRPKITDANGNWTWGKLNIDEKNGTLTIEIDQSWLDKAVYPVKIDPTFGYDTMGSSEAASNDYMYGSYFEAPESGTLDQVSCGVRNTDAISAHNNSGAVYNYNTLGLVDSAASGQSVVAASGDVWKHHTLNNESITGGTNYLLVSWSDAWHISLNYDTATGLGKKDTNTNYDNWPATFTVNATYNMKFSIYCTYTAGPPDVPWTDNFDDNSIDENKWEKVSSSWNNAAEQNQQMELISASSGSAIIKTKGNYDLRGTQIYIKVTQHSNDGGFKLSKTYGNGAHWPQWDIYEESNYYNFQPVSGPKVRVMKKKNGSTSYPAITGVLTTPYWLRIRVVGGVVYFDYVNNQSSEPTEGQWVNLYNESWDLGDDLTNEFYIFFTAYNTPSTNSLNIDNFSFLTWGPPGIKAVNNVAIGSIKTINDVGIDSVKTINDAS